MLLILVSIFCVLLNGITAFWHSTDISTRFPSTKITRARVQTTIPSQNTSYARTPVRLVGGGNYREGRVEVYHDGQWGTICDDSFGLEDARVICSMLGYGRNGMITAYSQARFGQGTGTIMLSYLGCTGYENDITQCVHTGWHIRNCDHNEDAGVACNPGNSTSKYGSTKQWHVSTTYRYGSRTYRHGSTTYRRGSSANRYNSTLYVTVGYNGHIPLRLNAGYQGSLMLYYNGRWGYVCYNSYQRAYQFNAVCRYLGYTSAYSIDYQYQSQPALVTDFRCPGYYYSKGVDDCTGSNFGGNTYCNNKLYITCNSLTTEESVTTPFSIEETSVAYTNVRLVGGSYNWEGRVEIYHNGSWGTICDDQFDSNDAKVICAMLGYNISGSVTAYGNAYFGAGNGPILLDDLGCNGYESDVLQCKSGGWYGHNCGHGEDASVSCRYPKSGRLSSITSTRRYPTSTRYSHRSTIPTAGVLGRYYGHLTYRLTNGNNGFLQIYYNGQWGYVCYNSTQYSSQFHSACRYLGYSSAYNVYGRHEGSYAIVTDFHCPSSYYNSNYSSNGIDGCTGYRLGYSNYCNDKLFIVCDLDVSTVGYEVTTTDVLGSHGRIPIRLTSGSHGFLQIYYNGRWGYVCHSSSHSTYQFNSVCRSLGYSYAYSVYGSYDSSHTALVTDLKCPRSYYHNYSSNGIDDCTGDRLGYTTYCNDKLYIECGPGLVTTEETATLPFKTGCQSVTSSPADVIFVVDESGSVGNNNFDRTRASIVDTIRHLDIRNDFIRIGVMTFDDNSRTVFNLNSYPGDPNSMANRVMSMPYSSGGTDIADALSHACSNMFTSYNGDRSNATNYLVLLTDGQSQAQQEADRCKAGGTKIISVGIGDSINEQVLRNLAYNYDYYLSTNYSDIAGFLPKLVTTAVNCGGLESTNAKHITVNCQHSSWYVKVHLPPMEQKYSDFKDTDIYLGSHSCTGTRSGDYLIFNEDYTTCGTNKIPSANGVIYTNTLVYAVHDPNQPYIVHEYRFQVSVECDMSKQESGENNINNIHGNLEQQTISGVGHFVVQLKFFSDSNFQHEFSGFPPSYMVGQNVYVKATTPIHDYNVKMRLSDCYTKPSKSASDSYIYYLIQHGCPAAPSAFITTKSTHETRFHFQDFEYAFHPHSMYVHCNATFCNSNDYSRDCEPRCGNRKRVGSIDQEDEPIEGVGPIGYAEDEATVLFQKGSEALNAGKKPEVENKGNKPLYVAGVVVVAVAMVAILVVTSIYFRSKRRQNGQSKIV